MEALVEQSISTFEQILDKLNSSDEKEKELAMGYAQRLRTQLEKQAEKAMDQLDLSAKELEAFTQKKENFSEEEWAALEKAKQELQSYREHVDTARAVDTGEATTRIQSKRKKKPARSRVKITG